MGLLQTNATVSTARGGQPVNQHIRVWVDDPGPENFSPEGVQVETPVLFTPGTNCRQGDVLIVEKIDGHPDLDQITKYKVIRPPKREGGLLPVMVVTVEGILQ